MASAYMFIFINKWRISVKNFQFDDWDRRNAYFAAGNVDMKLIEQLKLNTVYFCSFREVKTLIPGVSD